MDERRPQIDSFRRRNDDPPHKKHRVSTQVPEEVTGTVGETESSSFAHFKTLASTEGATTLFDESDDSSKADTDPLSDTPSTTGTSADEELPSNEIIKESHLDDESDCFSTESCTSDTGSSSSSSSDFDDDSIDPADREQEDALVQELVHAVFTPKRQQQQQKQQQCAARKLHTFVRWISDPDCKLSSLKRDPIASSVSLPIKPSDHLQTLLRSAQLPCTIIPASSLLHFFAPVTDDYVRGYTLEVAKAVRADDVPTLQNLLAHDRLVLPCGTSYGDSILHTACRRQCVRVVAFLLMNQQNHDRTAVPRTTAFMTTDNSTSTSKQPQPRQQPRISVRLQNQCGRTPLTDCCWTTIPQVSWHAAIALLAHCPDLLYVSDRHGSTPLDYVPPHYWPDWCRFLDQMGPHRLAARDIHTKTTTATTTTSLVSNPLHPL